MIEQASFCIKNFLLIFVSSGLLFSVSAKAQSKNCYALYETKEKLALTKNRGLDREEKSFLVSMKGVKSDLVEVEIPVGMGADLQIEIYGNQKTRYQISSVFLSNGKILVADTSEGIATKNFVEMKDLETYRIVSQESTFAYNSVIRSLPGAVPGVNSLVIPARYLNSKVPLKMYLQFRSDTSTPLHKIKTRVITRKKIRSNQPTIVELNFLVAEGVSLAEKSLTFEILLKSLNEIYSVGNIQFKLNSFQVIDKKYQRLMVGNNFSKLFSDITTETPYGINLVISNDIMDAYGRLNGLSLGMPGASSTAGLKTTGILLAISSSPDPSNINQINLWVIEMANNLSHEIGHFLGLHHTFESDSKTLVDVLKDTPEQESYNLMNPYSVRDQPLRLSPMQIRNILAHPVVTVKPK